MEKLKRYKKEIIGITLIIIIIIGSTMLFSPDKLGSDNPGYKSIEEKRINLINSNDKSSELSYEIKSLKETEIIKNEEMLKAQRNAENKKETINVEDLEFHLPSILIRFENNAIKNNLKIDIDHSGIRNYEDNNMESVNASNIEELEAEVEDIENAEVTEDASREDEALESKDEPIDEESSDDNIQVHEVPFVYGFNTTIIPLTVEGQFSDVRSFINYLDKLNYIENTSISLYSDGNKVTGNILVSIFHGSI